MGAMSGDISGWAYYGMIQDEIATAALRADCIHERTQLVPWLNNDGWSELCLDCGRKVEL